MSRYQKKYNLTKVNCATDPSANDPNNFYTNGRTDFKNRISHILSYKSKYTNSPIGLWENAIFSIDPQNEAFGHVDVPKLNEDWLCDMATYIKQFVEKSILVSSGGGGIGNSSGALLLSRVSALAKCAGIDILAPHTYAGPVAVDLLLANYKSVSQSKRIVLQEWGVTGENSTLQAQEFTALAAVAAKHGVPQMYWQLQPSSLPMPSTQLGISPPSPAPSPGQQRTRSADGSWNSRCTNTSCPTEVWVTALYPAVQNAVLQVTETKWPEIWGCGSDADCRYNGRCVDGNCVCDQGWRGPTCAALLLAPTPKENGFRHENTSSWGGSIMKDSTGQYHMFASQITEGCGLNAWSTNSQIIRAVSNNPIGPYTFKEVVAPRFAHEPNLVFGTGNDKVILLGTMYPEPPSGYENCTGNPGHDSKTLKSIGDAPHRNTYVWAADSPEKLSSVERQLAIDASIWNIDPLHNSAICDTNAAAAITTDASLIGVWRHCETSNLHTVPHTFSARDSVNGSTYLPNISATFPFMSHAGAEDPMVYSRVAQDGQLILHAVLHDEQITRCADAPVGCWPGGRHAFSSDNGQTWDYSSFDAYNGTIEYTDGTSENAYLRARPHLLVESSGKVVALSNGLRPAKASDYVYTLLQPVVGGGIDKADNI